MAPAAAATRSAVATTTWSSSAKAARPITTASSQSPSRRTVPGLLVFFSLAALLILSSGDDAAAYEAAASERPFKDVSLGNPEVTFAPSSMGGKFRFCCNVTNAAVLYSFCAAPGLASFSNVSLENPEVTFAPSSMGGKFCERIRVSGIPRWRLQSYANQIHIRMNVSHSMPEKFHWKVGICFHGNASMGLCECEMGESQLLQDGVWNAVKSPYGSKYVDVKLADKKSTAFSLSIQEDLQTWRLACLAIGFVLLFLSPIVSKWAPFYYSSSMALGILLVVLIVLFQGMKLLPMGKKSFLYLTIYGSVLGAGSYAVHYFSTLVASILENFGFSEEMHNPVSIFLLVAIVLTGAGFGYWMVRRFIVSKDGSVDAGIAQFVKWAMRVVAIFFVMQSSLDPILASVALAASWWVCSVLTANKVHRPMSSKQKQSKVPSHPRFTQVSPNTRQVQFLSPSSRAGIGRVTSTSSATQYGWNNSANGGLVPSTLTRRAAPTQDEDYYSTFHNFEPRKYSKSEWAEFTEESTRNALRGHTATPEFAQWAADNAHRLRVEREEASEDETIESSSSSSEEAEEVDEAPGLFGRRWF